MTRPRQIRVEGDVAYIPLTRGYEAVIDAADVPLVAGVNWSVDERRRKDGTLRNVYVGRIRPRGDGTYVKVYLHQIILPCEGGLMPDHIDGDGLNCRRDNLRKATEAQNNKNLRVRSDNSSGVKGVTYCVSRALWQAKIRADGRLHHLGRYARLEDAAAAYAAASAKLHGEFGRTA